MNPPVNRTAQLVGAAVLAVCALTACDKRTPVQPETSTSTPMGSTTDPNSPSTGPSSTTPPDVTASGAPSAMPGASSSGAMPPAGGASQ